MKSAKRSGLTRRRTGRLRPRAARLLPWMNGKLCTLEARSPRDLGPACNEGGWAVGLPVLCALSRSRCYCSLLYRVAARAQVWRLLKFKFKKLKLPVGRSESRPLSPARSPLAVAAPAGSYSVKSPAGRAASGWPLATKAQLYTQCADWPRTDRPIRASGTSLNWALSVCTSGRRLALLAGAI
jgi:hypothetical protein